MLILPPILSALVTQTIAFRRSDQHEESKNLVFTLSPTLYDQHLKITFLVQNAWDQVCTYTCTWGAPADWRFASRADITTDCRRWKLRQTRYNHRQLSRGDVLQFSIAGILHLKRRYLPRTFYQIVWICNVRGDHFYFSSAREVQIVIHTSGKWRQPIQEARKWLIHAVSWIETVIDGQSNNPY